MTNDIWKYAAVSVVSAAVGGGVTYLVTRKRINKKAEALANEEIKSVKERYALLRKEGKYADPATAIKAYQGREAELHEAVEAASLAAAYQAESDVEEAAEVLQQRVEVAEEVEEAVLEDAPSPLLRPEAFAEEPEVRNIFDQHSAETAEVKVGLKVDKSRPYIIPEEEYMDGDEDEYSKLTITYWEEDDTLCDEREAIIPDIEGTVGAVNLHSFDDAKNKSNQRDVVYVRNERLKADYEIVRLQQSYSKVVLGMRDEDEDHRPRNLKMRRYDE